MTTALLSEAEAAERLRCSPAKIKCLRLSGRLAYLPGRPVFLTEAAIDAYIQTYQQQRPPTISGDHPPRFHEDAKSRAESVSAEQWVRERLARRGPSFLFGSGAVKGRFRPPATETVAVASSRKPKTKPKQD